MHGLDIIFLAVVAAFLLFRLYNALGQEDNETQERVRNLQKIMEQTLTGQEEAAEVTQNQHTQFRDFLKTVSASEKSIIQTLWEKWPQFDPAQFFKGARKAFIMIVEGFAEGKLKDLQELLSPALFRQFQNIVEERKAKGETHVTKVETLRTVRLVDARFNQDSVILVLDIQSFQSYSITNKQGKVLHDTQVDLEELWDRWSFSKNITNPKPHWKLINIESTPEDVRS